MADKREINPGTMVRLNGPNGPLPEKYKVIQTIDKERIRLEGPDGAPLRAFRSRITVEESRVEKEEKERKMEEQAATETKETKTKEKKKTPKKTPTPIDMKEYCTKHGGENYTLLKKKDNKFDSPGYKLTSHILINKKKSTYRTFNVYTNPSGIMTTKGGNEYPLKGKTLTITNKDGSNKTYTGKLTIEQLIAAKEKAGYEQTQP
jgi:hypothetical protein